MDKKRQKNLDKDIEMAIKDIKRVVLDPNEKREIIIKAGKQGSVTGISEENKIIYTVPRQYVDELNSLLYVDISSEPKRRVSKLINSRIAKQNKEKLSNKKTGRFIEER